MKQSKRTYSRYCEQAVELLGQLVTLTRKKQNISVAALAERAGIARSTLQRIEEGDLHCEIGVVFEVAAILGIQLFESNQNALSKQIQHTQSQLVLLPKRVHKNKKDVDDDF